MRLSDHFELREFTASAAAARLGLDNAPPSEVVARLRLVASALEVVRLRLGGWPMRVTSGYRTPEVNAAVGGSATSDHMSGWCADVVVAGVSSSQIFRVVWCCHEQGLIKIDQALRYPIKGHVHISVDPEGRGYFGEAIAPDEKRFTPWRPV